MPTPPPLRGAAAVVRFGLCLVAGNLLAPLGAAQCSNPFVVPNQTLTSGTHNFPDNNAVKANSVSISGSASVTWSYSGAQSHQVTAQSSPTTYTAAFVSGALQAVQLGNPFGTRVRPEKLAIVALKLVPGGVN